MKSLNNTTKVFKKKITTPLGDMVACATENGICMLQFQDRETLNTELIQVSKFYNSEILEVDHPLFETLEKELESYFNNQLKDFTLKLDFVGTDFQKKVWNCLCRIPFGTTASYQQQAVILGNPKAVRAVAKANGQNKIAIIVPCHRVIASNGKLTGYSGGLGRKEKLLALEKLILF